ncbi:beta-N-acetylhexosaminidase [Hyalangium gracile]|uniref:beta-N-acetylhexosaminidase n=1 Tax=Hyalangium gracile TaxID=394092 RepID=UPI0021E156A6|nr:family 20 glycosylhydrolase [Hyalangium gracile]
MPVPASLQFRDGRLPVTAAFSIHVQGSTDRRLEEALRRMLRRLEGRTSLTLSREPAEPQKATLVLEVKGPGNALPTLGDDESYSLEVDGSRATLRATQTVGALRGIETMLQLLQGDRDGWYLPAVTISDRPRFPWRGLLIDVSRHWMPMDVLKRNLDGMAAVKLNVLHLHLTDDQGFRVESRRFPELHEQGSDGLYFTQEQVRELIAYAADRGIRVVPEFDMPGHVTSWLVSHPELASVMGPYSIQRKWGIFDPTLDPTRDQVYAFLDAFLGEMAQLFPDPWMHIGGDENTGNHWRLNPAIQSFMAQHRLADAHALQAYFDDRVAQLLQKHGKRMMGWDEILHPTLPRDAVVQTWRGPKALAESARQGYSGILSWGYYLDHMLPAGLHYTVDPLPADGKRMSEEANRWIPVSWYHRFQFKPPEVAIPEKNAVHVLGGEACMWSEFVDAETIDSRLWPRLTAVAERLWSPRNVTDVKDMYRRMARISVQLEEHGLMHERIGEVLLRRLAGSNEIGPLRALANLVEPVKFYDRPVQFQEATQGMPLTRLVDAARPESLEARALWSSVDDLLSDAPRFDRGAERLTRTFHQWREFHPELRQLLDNSPALHEARPLADALLLMAQTGLEALASLESGTTPRPGWREEALQRLNEAARPHGQVELATLQPLRELVLAAALQPEASALPAAAWQARVKAEALAAIPKPPEKKK